MELPSIFIGRSLSSATRRWLKKQPIRFIEHPISHVKYRKPNVKFLQSLKDEQVSLVVTSSYAAHWLMRFYKYFGTHIKYEVFCLSEKQRDILQNTQLKIHLAKEPNTFSLAQLIKDKSSGQRAIYLRGDKALNDLYERLFSEGIHTHELEVYKNTPFETWINEAFDAYLFFSPTAIESYKAAGNFPAPNGIIMAVGESTARRAWTVFPNTVNQSYDHEELSFVKFSVDRLMKKINEPAPTEDMDSM